MSVLQHLSVQVLAAVKEFKNLQETRKKARMNHGNLIGQAALRAFKSEDDIVQQDQEQVVLGNIGGKLYLICGSLVLPCDLIFYYSCVNNTITLRLKDDKHFPYKKIIFDMESIHQVDDFINKVKPPEKPRPNTYQHDGNVTSSSADSDESGRGGTGGVNNSFESDNPSSNEDF